VNLTQLHLNTHFSLATIQKNVGKTDKKISKTHFPLLIHLLLARLHSLLKCLGWTFVSILGTNKIWVP